MHPVQESPVHPRVCGERSTNAPAASSQSGSSPRVWGTPAVVVVALPGMRFIPACVGNAPHTSQKPCNPSVHPRVCGERFVCFRSYFPSVGSSPRVWGTLIHTFKDRIGKRFIPACVGNAIIGVAKTEIGAVHPRVCGERPLAVPIERIDGGSSPRVWGTPLPPKKTTAALRFIPACVGNAPIVDAGPSQ